jgi:hypothetical protein
MTKLLRTIPLVIVLIFYTVNLQSQEKNSSKKNRLVIYNFTTTDNYNEVQDKGKNYQYYSIVIPETISKNLQKSKNYQIRREEGPLSIQTTFTNDKEKKIYIKNLIQASIKNKTDYIITGTFNVIKNKLKISVTIFNVKGKDIETVDNESSELGVLLNESTDLISQRVIDNIENLDKLNIKRANDSPFTTLYKPFSIMTLGLDAGYIFIMGKWDPLFNDTTYFSPFIDLSLTENFSLSLKFTSIQSDSEGKDTGSDSIIRIMNGSISLNYEFKMTESLGIIFSAGGGLAKTIITVGATGPFTDPLAEKKSYDPSMDLSSWLNYKLSPVILRGGILYKRIFYQDEPMNSMIIFMGAGIHF